MPILLLPGGCILTSPLACSLLGCCCCFLDPLSVTGASFLLSWPLFLNLLLINFTLFQILILISGTSGLLHQLFSSIKDGKLAKTLEDIKTVEGHLESKAGLFNEILIIKTKLYKNLRNSGDYLGSTFIYQPYRKSAE